MNESSLVRLNNLLAEFLASEPGSEARLRRLRHYARALIEPVQEHVALGLLSHVDAIRIMLSASLFFALASGSYGLKKRGLGRLAMEVFQSEEGPGEQ